MIFMLGKTSTDLFKTLSFDRCFCFASLISFAVFGCISSANASDIDPLREDMQKQYFEQNLSSLNFFAGVPIGHVIPERDQVITATSVDYRNVNITPISMSSNASDASQISLTIKGYGAAPFVSFSNDRFGMSCAGELGQYESLFENKSGSTSQYSYYNAQMGKLTYSGLGIYGYFMPKISMLPRTLTANFVTGLKQLYATHETSTAFTEANTITNSTKYRYSLKKIELGLDLGIHLAKRFYFIPWVNYTKIQIGNTLNGSNQPIQANDSTLIADKELFWTSKPSLSYGLDFAVSISRVQLHLGGILGLIAGLAKGSDSIVDKSITLSLSYSAKENNY